MIFRERLTGEEAWLRWRDGGLRLQGPPSRAPGRALRVLDLTPLSLHDGTLDLDASKYTWCSLMCIFLFQSNSRLLFKGKSSDQQTFSVKSQMVSILDFEGQILQIPNLAILATQVNE